MKPSIAGEVDAAAPDCGDDEVLARVDGSGPGVEGEGEDEVTRTG